MRNRQLYLHSAGTVALSAPRLFGISAYGDYGVALRRVGIRRLASRCNSKTDCIADTVEGLC